MKIVINNSWGGFMLPKEFVESVGCKNYWEVPRDNEQLVKATEEHKEFTSSFKVVEVPDKTADYKIVDYDGMESVYFVVDNRIYIIS